MGFSKVICEYERNISSVVILSRSRQPKECPQRWLYIQGQCYLVVRYIKHLTSDENAGENVCRMPSSKIASTEHLYFLQRYLPSLLGQNPVVYLLMEAGTHTTPTSHCLLVPSDIESRYASASGFSDAVGSNCVSLSKSAHGVVCSIEAEVIVLETCLPGLYMCQDGTCILNKYLCDGKAQCPDKSDEVNCTDVCVKSTKEITMSAQYCFSLCHQPQCKCSWKYFQCQGGGCVAWWAVCDCVEDCLDGSDETQCMSCHTDMKQIVAAMTVLDHERDPVKPNDDRQIRTPGSNSTCMRGYSPYLDQPDQCFPSKELCIFEKLSGNRIQHCGTGGHLLSCTRFECPDFYKCPSSYCIPLYKVCNGEADCPNGEDEGRCEGQGCPGFLRCGTEEICVHPKDIQDGEVHCTMTANDEDIYIGQPCPDNCLCVGGGLNCEQLNVIATLPPVYHEVKMLILNGAKVYHNETIFRPFRKMLGLDMSSNELSHLYGGLFTNQQQLIILNLEKNSLKYIKRNYFTGLSNLRHLILKHNPIQVSDSFAYTMMGMAEYLDLSGLQLKQIAHNAFHGMKSCSVLNVSFNEISEISYGIFRGLSVLKVLDLRGNSIKSFNPGEFFIVRMLHKVYMPQKEFCCQGTFSDSCSPSGIGMPCQFYTENHVKVLGWCLVVLGCTFNGVMLSARAFGKKNRLWTLNILKNLAGILMTLSLSLVLVADLFVEGSIVSFSGRLLISSPAHVPANFLYITSFTMQVALSAIITIWKCVAVILPLKANMILNLAPQGKYDLNTNSNLRNFGVLFVICGSHGFLGFDSGWSVATFSSWSFLWYIFFQHKQRNSCKLLLLNFHQCNTHPLSTVD